MRRWELQRWLTVVALAILGSALFVPIVAQSRLNRDELCLVRIRTVALGVLMYAQDYDETMPLAFGRLPSGQWMWNRYHAVPYNWRSDQEDLFPIYASMWANAIIPYLPERGVGTVSRYEWLRCPASLPKRIENINYSVAQRRPVVVSYAYNGLLHQLPINLVANPAAIPIVWEGRGANSAYGLAISNPFLRCDNPNNTCRYYPCDLRRTGGMLTTEGSLWIHSKGVLFAFIDGHTEWRRLGLVVNANTDYNYDPYTGYDETGVPWFYWWDGCYPWLFRPYTQ